MNLRFFFHSEISAFLSTGIIYFLWSITQISRWKSTYITTFTIPCQIYTANKIKYQWYITLTSPAQNVVVFNAIHIFAVTILGMSINLIGLLGGFSRQRSSTRWLIWNCVSFSNQIKQLSHFFCPKLKTFKYLFLICAKYIWFKMNWKIFYLTNH